MSRPTLDQVHRFILDTPYINVPQGQNKGLVGLILEELAGIPRGSAHIDCEDGEVKSFPLKRSRDGTLVPKETIAVTMLNTTRLTNEAEFASSGCGTKLERVLYVPYLREGDRIRLFPPSDVRMTSEMYETLGADYTSIRTRFLADGTLESATGTFLQNRTKGAGRGAPKTRAFYLRKEFIHRYIPRTW